MPRIEAMRQTNILSEPFFSDFNVCVLWWILWVTFTRHFAELEKMDEVLAKFSAKKANCFSETDRVFVNKTICALYGSLEEFDQYIREGLRPIIRSMSTGFVGEFLMIFRMLSPLCLDNIILGFADVLLTPNHSFGMLLLFVCAMLSKLLCSLSLMWVQMRFVTYTFRRQRCLLGIALLLVFSRVGLIVAEGFAEVLFNLAGRDFLFYAGIRDQYVCNLEKVPAMYVDKAPVPAEEQECISTLVAWFCRPTDIFGSVPIVLLLGYLTMASGSDKTSDFMGDESPFSVEEPGKEEPQKQRVDAV